MTEHEEWDCDRQIQITYTLNDSGAVVGINIVPYEPIAMSKFNLAALLMPRPKMMPFPGSTTAISQYPKLVTSAERPPDLKPDAATTTMTPCTGCGK
ncbi:hypothetical protein [Candidatus Magnetominusculus xianensis]|uniref:Uncharacterized protein n=1 Tax=Candidatus Magnetominusculus xianensis TaxID=1748249 RepID=A0ABR5SGT7_9BACT|nr:hypothetical protein [Candidatus Magnetominusculus xianensis]KWT81139.1 hypothetical protein ASN18_2645 [Candidatus Magnetominusculus xianensis]MBF0402969.1 hypothetical protein [Nitrospirota bacterium]